MHSQMLKMSSIEQNEIISEEYILKALNNVKVQYKNQFTSLLTKCIFCNNICLYINKITGKYLKKLLN